MHFDEHFIRRAIPEVSLKYVNIPSDVTFSIDSRTVQKGQIFVALEGKHHDGHSFLKEVIERGVCGIMIAHSKQTLLASLDPALLENVTIITVPDTKQALITLATQWRNQFNYPVVAITGSVGKTTTKTLLSTLCTRAGIAHVASYGNQNTFIGLSLNMLNMRAHHQAAIFEIGISGCNEMAHKAQMVKPTTALITNIGHAHMEGIGSLADIAQQKRAIFSHFTPENVGVVNGDFPLLANISYKHPIVKFGLKTTNQIQARKVRYTADNTLQCILKIYGKKYTITLPTNHRGAINNILAATAMAYLLKIPEDIIISTIQESITIEGRFEKKALKKGNGLVIHDCYNANPESMKCALEAFEHIDTPAQKIAVLGDMLELGIDSDYWHRQIGRFMTKAPSVRTLVLVGSKVKELQKALPVGLTVHLVPSWQEAVDYLQHALPDNALILVKGSRGMQLQNVVNSFT